MKHLALIALLVLAGCRNAQPLAPVHRTGHWMEMQPGNFDASAMYVYNDTGEVCGKIRPDWGGPAYELMAGPKQEILVYATETQARKYVESVCP